MYMHVTQCLTGTSMVADLGEGPMGTPLILGKKRWNHTAIKRRRKSWKGKHNETTSHWLMVVIRHWIAGRTLSEKNLAFLSQFKVKRLIPSNKKTTPNKQTNKPNRTKKPLEKPHGQCVGLHEYRTKSCNAILWGNHGAVTMTNYGGK